MFSIRDAAKHEGNLNARSWILQKFEVFHGANSFAQLQFDVRTRKNFPILAAVIFERRAFESCRHCNLRRRRGNEIDQNKRNTAHDAGGRSQSFEQLPTIVSQHGWFPICVRRGKTTVTSSYDSNTQAKLQAQCSGGLWCPP